MSISTKKDSNFVFIDPLSQSSLIDIKNILDLIPLAYRGTTENNAVIDKEQVSNSWAIPCQLDPSNLKSAINIVK